MLSSRLRTAVVSGLTAVAVLSGYLVIGAHVAPTVERQSVTWVTAAQEVPDFTVRMKRDMGFVAAGAALVSVHGKGPDRTLGRCTIGSPWRTPDGTVGYVTAGHCGDEGDDITVLTGDYFTRAGSVAKSIPPHVVDVAFVAADPVSVLAPAPVVRSSGGSTQILRKRDVPITSFGDALVGDKVCAVGTSSGTTCDWTVVDTDRTMHAGAHLYRGVFATGYGDQCIVKGDSGGPVFALKDGQARLVGLVSALSNKPAPEADDATYRCGLLIAPVSAIKREIGGKPLLATVVAKSAP